MKGLIERFARWVTEHRALTLCLGAAVLLPLCVGLAVPGLHFEADNEIWFLEGDPVLEAYHRIPELFGDNMMAIVALEDPSGDVVDSDSMEKLDAITRWLEAHPLTLRAQSLTNYQKVYGSEGGLSLEPLWPLGERHGTLESLRAELRNDDLIAGTLVTRDFGAAVVYVQLQMIRDGLQPYSEFTEALEAFIAGTDWGQHAVHISGPPVFASLIVRLSTRDSAILIPMALGVIAILLTLLFRRAVGVWPPLLAVFASAAATFGGMAATGHRANMINAQLVLILLPVALADCVHVLTVFFQHYRIGEGGRGNAPAAARASVRQLFLPCLLTTVTTACGFLALTASALRPLAELGYEAAFGVVLAWLLSMTVLPALLSGYTGRAAEPGGLLCTARATVWARGLADFCFRARFRIVGVAVLLVVAAATQIGKIRTETTNQDYVRPDNPYRITMERVDSLVGGAADLEILLDAGRRDGVKEPEFLRKVEKLSAWIEASPITAKPISGVDLIKRINQALKGEWRPNGVGSDAQRDFNVLPSSRALVAQMLLAYEMAGDPRGGLQLSYFVDDSYRYYRLPVRMPSLPRTQYEEFVGDLQTYLRTEMANVPVELTGMIMLFTAMDRRILDTQRTSSALALVAVVAFLFFILRSVKLGLLAIVPNVVPLLLAGGVMGLLDIPLDFGTTMVAAITFGLVVDDTIHLLTRLRAELGAGRGLRDAVRGAFRHTAFPILFTSLILCAGFVSASFSAFVPNSRLGVFSTLIIAAACVADLVLVPALLFVFSGKAAFREGASVAAPRRLLVANRISGLGAGREHLVLDHQEDGRATQAGSRPDSWGDGASDQEGEGKDRRAG